jgi:precorrin-6y C5,15-methyltransferase (decarboxylating) CbiE subunit
MRRRRVPKFAVIGMGPGGLDYLLPVSRRAIEEADLLVGAQRFLVLFPGKDGRAFGAKTEEALDIVEAERGSRRVALLVSGDPGLYSFLGSVRRRFRPEDYEVLPGLSSFQLAFAKAGLSWEGAVIVSVHGRGLEALGSIEADRPAVIFLGGENDAAGVAEKLSARFGPERRCIVARELGMEGETIVEGGLAEISTKGIGGLCVMLLP